MNMAFLTDVIDISAFSLPYSLQGDQQQQQQPDPADHFLPRGDLACLRHAAAHAAQEENR